MMDIQKFLNTWALEYRWGHTDCLSVVRAHARVFTGRIIPQSAVQPWHSLSIERASVIARKRGGAGSFFCDAIAQCKGYRLLQQEECVPGDLLVVKADIRCQNFLLQEDSVLFVDQGYQCLLRAFSGWLPADEHGGVIAHYRARKLPDGQ